MSVSVSYTDTGYYLPVATVRLNWQFTRRDYTVTLRKMAAFYREESVAADLWSGIATTDARMGERKFCAHPMTTIIDDGKR